MQRPESSGPVRQGRGMVLGKFLPPHRGHLYLVRFAEAFTERLTVVVGTLKAEPIPGALRYQWMKSLCADVDVVHLEDENPQDPSEHPDFWRIWRESLERVLPYKPDYVFASEPYGEKLAEVLGATFVPVDLSRTAVPISGTEVRDDPFGHWDLLPECVRAHYTRRVCVFGPESTGKTTLARDLAQHYETRWVPEYAREWLEPRSGELKPADFEFIARGQAAAEDALLGEANRVLIQDTDVLATQIWSNTMTGACAPWIKSLGRTRRADLYLVTDIDVPWIDDMVRYLPEDREAFHRACIDLLHAEGCRVVNVRGSWSERWATAQAAVDELMSSGSRPDRSRSA